MRMRLNRDGDGDTRRYLERCGFSRHLTLVNVVANGGGEVLRGRGEDESLRLGLGTLVKKDWGPLAPTDRSTAGAWSTECVSCSWAADAANGFSSRTERMEWGGELVVSECGEGYCRPAWESTASPAFSLVLTFYPSSWPL